MRAYGGGGASQSISVGLRQAVVFALAVAVLLKLALVGIVANSLVFEVFLCQRVQVWSQTFSKYCKRIGRHRCWRLVRSRCSDFGIVV